MIDDDVFYDGKAQTGAAAFARARLVDAIETLEEARQMLESDARAKVADKKLHRFAALRRAQFDAPAFCGVAQGILHQIVEHLLDRVAIGVHGEGRRGSDPQLDSVMLC